MMFAWQKLTDARGLKWKPCTIGKASKISGYEKGFLVKRGDTARFIVAFLITGLPFAVTMTYINPILIGLAIGSSTPFDVFTMVSVMVFILYSFTFGGIMGGYLSLYAWRSPQHAIRAMTDAGLCPSCAYRIDEIGPEPDGCTVCPECGAAWRIQDPES